MRELPLVYACSGCSSAAQLANHLAVRLDRGGEAEMSCIAGVGGGVKALVRTAQRAAETSRLILAIDGCPLACVRACLARVGVATSTELRLHEHGVRKVQHSDFDPAQAEALLALCRDLLRSRAAADPA
ncbi:putative zinc-binding protein [Roseateles sp.]|uniref:putative zinc-binding protein n=1 Tax=Roseateles sp. TaxID=1971397 RepID=UPI0039E7C00D